MAAVVVVATAIAASALTCGSDSSHVAQRPSDKANARWPRVVAVAAHGSGGVVPTGAFRLEGQVVDEEDRPVADVTVTLRPGDVQTKSERDGSFAFDALPGRYYLRADRGELYSRRIAVQLDARSEPVTLHMIRGTTLVVRVLGDDRPLAGAQVRIEYAEPASTDVKGMARFAGRWPGSFVVSAIAPGYAQKTSRVEIEADPGGMVLHSLNLRRGASLSGTVVDDTGKLVANATIDVERLSDDETVNSTSDAVGAWRVDAVATGRYHISAKAKGYGPTIAAALELDGSTPRSGVVVRVASGGTHHDRVALRLRFAGPETAGRQG